MSLESNTGVRQMKISQIIDYVLANFEFAGEIQPNGAIQNRVSK